MSTDAVTAPAGSKGRVAFMSVRDGNWEVYVTGITGGQLVDGVRYEGNRVYTSSIVMRSLTATVRHIESEHHLGRLNLLTQFYD